MRQNFNRNIKLFLVSTLLYGISFSVWELFFNLYILSLGLSSSTLGLIRSASPLAALVLGIPLGLLSDRIGRKTSMIVGLVVGFIGMFFEVHLLNPILIAVFGLVQGAGIMLYFIAQPPFIMAASRKENQAMAFSLNFGLTTLASAVGSLAAGQIPGLLEGWLGLSAGTAPSYRWIITLGIILAATSLIPIFAIKETRLKNDSPAQQTPISKILKDIIRRPVFRRLALLNLMIGFGAAILIPYLNVFLKLKFGIADNLLGLIFSLSSLLVFIGALLSPWMVKIARSYILPIVVTQSASLAFLFLLGFSPSLPVVAISLLMRGILMQSASPLLDNFAMLVSPPEEQGTISSVRGISWQAGQMVGLYASGLVQSSFGFTPLFITTGALYTLASVLTWIYFRPQEKALDNVI
ncbi:MFS transporter [bacterium]|nr:MFS transporter [bacterium]